MNLHMENNASSRAGQQTLNSTHTSKNYDPPALSLDEFGIIQDCSESFELLLGFRHRDLVWHHVSRLFPQLKDVPLIQSGQINRLLNYLCHCGHLFLAQNHQGDSFSFYLSFVHIENEGRRSLRLIVQPSQERMHDCLIANAPCNA